MADRLDKTAQDVANSVYYAPGTRAIDWSVRDELDAERKLLLTAFEALEQGTTAPVIHEVQAQSVSVGTPPAALVITGVNFGTDNTKVYLEVGPATTGPYQAEASGHTDTNATFDLTGLTGCTASRVINLTITLQDSTSKFVRSFPVAVPTVA